MRMTKARLAAAGIIGAGLLTASVVAPAVAASGGTRVLPIYDHNIRTGQVELDYTNGANVAKGKYCLYDLRTNGNGVGFRVAATWIRGAWYEVKVPVTKYYTARNLNGSGTRICSSYSLGDKGKLKTVKIAVANTNRGTFYGSKTYTLK